MVNNYFVGEWLKDTHTGHVYEILEVYRTHLIFWTKIIKRIDGPKNELIKEDVWNRPTTCTFDGLDSYFIKMPTARILYGNKV